MSDDAKQFFASLAKRPIKVSGIANAPVIDATTGRQRYVDVRVGTSTVRVPLDENVARIAGGDNLRLVQVGSAGQAEYQLDGINGARPTSGQLQFMDDTTVGGFTYGAGDIILGGLGAADPNWWYDYSIGRWYTRLGDAVTGYEDANGDKCWGPPTDVHFFYDASLSSLLILNNTTEIARIDGETLSLVGFQRLGNPLGPCIEMGYIDDVDSNGDPVLVDGVQQRRYVWRVLGENGRALISMLSGTENNPNDAALFVGSATSASDTPGEAITWRDGLVTITSATGNLAGFEMSANKFTSSNGKVALVSEADDDFGEGLSLVAGAAADAGAIKWYASTTSNTAYGIDLCYQDMPNNQIVKLSHVSDGGLPGDSGPECYYIIRARDASFTFDMYGQLDLAAIKAGTLGPRGTDARITMSGYESGNMLTPGDVVQYNTAGLAAQVTTLSDARGVVAQLLLNTDIAVQLRLPSRATGFGIKLSELGFTYYKDTTAAHFSAARLVHYDWLSDAKVYDIELTDVGDGVSAGVHSVALLDTYGTDAPLQINREAVYYLVLTTTGIVSAGDLNFIQGWVSYVPGY